MPKTFHKQNGYALLFAILVTSILLSAGLGISNIIFKELQLSAIGKQSTISFYAADTGIECAYYWERHAPTGVLGMTSTFPKNADEVVALAGGSARCAGADIVSKFLGGTPNNSVLATSDHATTTFTLELDSFVGRPCALVTVEKGSGVTLIESRGFNVPCSASSDVRRVERALRYRIQTLP
ncbi:MAG: hypothetical protein A2542_02530 [Parcubacteria group bacterium RIFOXYD2_FULL_52_8]|nr:MAG: hypothetical protein A2542_02530 [Parcubacteria group bacterium RIFOXYD2_FULL_52_8]